MLYEKYSAFDLKLCPNYPLSGLHEGAELRTVTFPAKNITSCCFGGPDYSELYVTSSRFGLSEEEIRSHQPLAGSVFKVTGLGVCGFATPVYKG